MPEVQSIGATDYAQYQPTQYQQYDNQYTDSYGMPPEVYDENTVAMQETSKSNMGAKVLTAAIIGLGALGGGYLWGSHGKKAANTAKETAEKALEDMKNSEAVKFYDKLKEATDTIQNLAEENDRAFFGWMKKGSKFRKKVDELLNPIKDSIKKFKEEAVEAAEKAGEEAKEATDAAA